MKKQLIPLEKEFLIRLYKRHPRENMKMFCASNQISVTSFRSWLKQYEQGGIDGLSRKGNRLPDVLPKGVSVDDEHYKREIIRLRIENERLKKKYIVQMQGKEKIFIPLETKNTR